MLLELSRLGSMHEVAAELQTTTSTVSQSIAALGRDVGVALVEPFGRRVRLTPAGVRLAEHAVTILGAIDAARLDLDAAGEPRGVVRVAGFATAIRQALMPAIDRLGASHPAVQVRVHEHEPLEALDLLARDRMDVVLTYDYNLAPATWPHGYDVVELWRTEWGLAAATSDDHHDLGAAARRRWIVNSRNTADEEVVRTLAAMWDFTPDIAHKVDALDLVEDLIVSGHGVALLPLHGATGSGVTVTALRQPRVELRAYAVARSGRTDWPPIKAVLDDITGHSASG